MRVLTTTQPAGQQTTLLQGDKNPLQVQVLDVSVSPVTSSVRVYRDADTTVPLAQQNGSEQAPYASLQTAVNVAGVAPAGGTVVCVANRINLTQTFTYDGAGVNTRLNLVAQDGFDNNTPPTFGDYTLQNHAHVIFQGVKCGVGACTPTRLRMQNCVSGGLQMSNNSAAIIAAFQGPTAADNSKPWAIDNTHITDSNLYIFGMRIGGNLVIDGVSTDCSVRQCQFGVGGHVLVLNGTSALQMDLWSVASAAQNGYNLHAGTGPITVVDAPCLNVPEPTFAIPAFAGAGVAYVAVPITGARPGDRFVAAWAPAGLTLPASVALASGHYCDTNDAVNLALVATAAFAGSTSFGVKITRLPLGGLG